LRQATVGAAIGPAEIGEAKPILALQYLCYRVEAERYDEPAIPALTQTPEGLIGEIRTHRVLVARLGTEAVGSVRARRRDGTCRIGRLIVDPRLQGQGLGTRLTGEIEACFDAADRYTSCPPATGARGTSGSTAGWATSSRVREVRKICEAFMSPDSVTETLHFFAAEYGPHDLTASGGGMEMEGEDIEVLELPIDHALHMIMTGEIADGKTIMLLQHAALHLFGD
jgi:GNAT superfamily N-acetyltransferase